MPDKPLSANKFLALLSEGQRKIFEEEVYPVFVQYKLVLKTIDEDAQRYINDRLALRVKGNDTFIRMAMSVFHNRSMKQMNSIHFRSKRDGRFYLCIVHGFEVLALTFYTEVAA